MRKGASAASLSTFELVAMVAALMALNALGVDIMLPALPDIGAAFDLRIDNDRQLVIVVYMVLFGLSQLLYGPLTDSLGRRSVLLGALGVYIVGGVLCVFAPSFELLLAARALQGVGAGATRVVATAIVRDLTEGRRMAQIMSMAMTIFMIVPILAPGLGQLILLIAPWRWIFVALLIYGVIVSLWVFLRLPETLRAENTTPLRLRAIVSASGAVLRDRQYLGYMIASTLLMGCMFGYVTSSEQLFVEVFDLGRAFPLAFAAAALAMSAGAFANSRLVMRHGMRRLSQYALLTFTALSVVLSATIAAGFASFWIFFTLLALTLGVFAMIAGNFNALAMEHVGRTAGVAASIYGASTGAIGAIVGALIGRQFDGTPLPFALGLVVCAALSFAAVLWTERGRLFSATI